MAEESDYRFVESFPCDPCILHPSVAFFLFFQCFFPSFFHCRSSPWSGFMTNNWPKLQWNADDCDEYKNDRESSNSDYIWKNCPVSFSKIGQDVTTKTVSLLRYAESQNPTNLGHYMMPRSLQKANDMCKKTSTPSPSVRQDLFLKIS